MRAFTIQCRSALVAVCLMPAIARATVYQLSPTDDWFRVLSSNQLAPGDEVVLAGGVYSDSRKLKLWQRGTAEQPIVIRSAHGQRAVITRPDALQNVINIEGGQHLILRGLEVTGGSAGIRLGAGLVGAPNAGLPARNVTIEDSTIHDVGDVAVSANFAGQKYQGMIFRGNEIYNTSGAGEAFYLGCNDNACQFFDGLIERNYIHDLDGPGVEQGDGIELKYGSHDNIVRDNVIHDTRFPGIIAYGAAGNGGPNVIERNVIWSSAEQGIQVAADAIVRNNIVMSDSGEAFLSQNHQGATPGNLIVVNNTFISDRHVAVRIASTPTAPIVIANNAIFARAVDAIQLESTGLVTLSNNLGVGRTRPALDPDQFSATGDLATDFVGVDWRGPRRDVFPAAGSHLIGAAIADWLPADDFNDTPRTAPGDIGAYAFNAAGNSGWPIGPGIKRPVLKGDFNTNGQLDAADLDQLTAIVIQTTHALEFDLDGNLQVDQADRAVWISTLADTWFGDANLDGEFNSQDLVEVLQVGKYELMSASGATWSEGDWDGDQRFDSHDLVLAMADGGYELGPHTASSADVPEPSAAMLLAMGLVLWCGLDFQRIPGTAGATNRIPDGREMSSFVYGGVSNPSNAAGCIGAAMPPSSDIQISRGNAPMPVYTTVSVDNIIVACESM